MPWKRPMQQTASLLGSTGPCCCWRSSFRFDAKFWHPLPNWHGPCQPMVSIRTNSGDGSKRVYVPCCFIKAKSYQIYSDQGILLTSQYHDDHNLQNHWTLTRMQVPELHSLLLSNPLSVFPTSYQPNDPMWSLLRAHIWTSDMYKYQVNPEVMNPHRNHIRKLFFELSTRLFPISFNVWGSRLRIPDPYIPPVKVSFFSPT